MRGREEEGKESVGEAHAYTHSPFPQPRSRSDGLAAMERRLVSVAL